VDFVSAAATTPEVKRRGGPHALLTNLALFDFDRERGGFRLRSVHPGYTAEDVRERTGFTYESPATVPATAPPDRATVELIRGRIRDELAECYPEFARSMAEAA